MATGNSEGGETRNSRLRVFLSSILASLGGVFGQIYLKHIEEEEDEDLEMASRVVLHDQQRGGEKQKIEQGEGKNRRVLRDIGNLVQAPGVGAEGKTNITRPITRSIGAQLLAKGQKVADKNTKKPLAEVFNGVAVGKGVKAPALEKKDLSKPKTVVIIEEKVKTKEKNTKSVSSKKSGKTLTSVLTARSKAAYGLEHKPKVAIVDIDAADVEDELAAVEYIEDIYSFYKETEEDGRVRDYMGSQPEINYKIRAILVDWLIEVHGKFDLMPESLYLTVNIVDRVLSKGAVPRKELQLVGMGAMLIACKYEEIWAPEINDFLAACDNAYDREQILRTEKAILGKLEWYLTVPTPYVFLARYIKASVPSDDDEIESMVYFFAELGLVDYTINTHYSPSKFSAAAVYAARCTLNKTPAWTDTLKHHTGYSEDEIRECAKLLVGFHCVAAENKLKAVYRKYTNPEKGAVALLPLARHLLETSLTPYLPIYPTSPGL